MLPDSSQGPCRISPDAAPDLRSPAVGLTGCEPAAPRSPGVGRGSAEVRRCPSLAAQRAPLRIQPDLVAAVSVTRPRHSTTDDDLERLGPVVRRAADAIAEAARQQAPVARPARPSGLESWRHCSRCDRHMHEPGQVEPRTAPGPYELPSDDDVHPSRRGSRDAHSITSPLEPLGQPAARRRRSSVESNASRVTKA